jgi:hypothetical protein
MIFFLSFMVGYAGRDTQFAGNYEGESTTD